MKIDFDKLLAESIAFEDVRICGVYFLFHEGKLVYLGASQDIMMRVRQHSYKKVFDRFAYIEVPLADLDMTERILLTRHRPKYNVLVWDRIKGRNEILFKPSLLLDHYE